MSQNLPQTLRNNCRERLFQMMEGVKAKCSSGFFILIGDEQTIPVISSCFKQKDLMNHNILSIERIDQDRNRYAGQPVVYLLTPTVDTLKELNNDFYDEFNAYYGQVYLHFTNKVNDDMFRQIVSNSTLKKRLKCFKEINLDFCLTMENQFDLNLKDDIQEIYCSKSKDEVKTKIANQLSTVILTYPQFSNIEIIYHENQNNISQNIAEQVQSRLNEDIQKLQASKSDQISPNAGKLNLLIFDRNFDIVSPALRDFYYQPMLYDINSVSKDVIKYKNDEGQPRVSLLTEDWLFEKYKFWHISEAMQLLSNEMQTFKQENIVAQLQAKGGDLSMAEMKKMTSGLPQYKELLAKYQMHLNLVNDCFEYFEEHNLQELGDVEQTLLSGLTENSEKLSQKQLLSKVATMCSSQSNSKQDKLRLAFVACLLTDISQKDKENLISQFENQDAFQNVVYLGPKQQQYTQSKFKKIVDKKRQHMNQNPVLNQDQILTRTITQVEATCMEILEENSEPNKPLKSLPSGFNSIQINCTGDAPSSPKKKGGLKNMAKKNQENTQTQIANQTSNAKFIVFVAGGISQLEVRSISHAFVPYQDCSLVIGGTSYTNPQDYIEKLEKLQPN